MSEKAYDWVKAHFIEGREGYVAVCYGASASEDHGTIEETSAFFGEHCPGGRGGSARLASFMAARGALIERGILEVIREAGGHLPGIVRVPFERALTDERTRKQ